MLDASTWAVCDKCSAVVVDLPAHLASHRGVIDAMVRTAREAVREYVDAVRKSGK